MTAPERGTATLARDLARRVGLLARPRVAAGRSRARYPPEHPADRTSLDRLMQAEAPDDRLVPAGGHETHRRDRGPAKAWAHS